MNLHIDIEINEPYSIENGLPLHFYYYSFSEEGWTLKETDSMRDAFFSLKGWFVVKFSEEQVISFPDRCCKVIYKLVRSLFPNMKFLEDFNTNEDLIPVKCWSIIDCINLERQNYREKYLKLDVKHRKVELNETFQSYVKEHEQYLNISN
ncbi:MAG: hypothetical protein NTZ85_01835 [Bacteroidia bacterium]|nr:hypothetical protein [Bacteroidia bacterium]